MATTRMASASGDSYLDCVIRFPLKAIKSERQHDQAVTMISRLSVRGTLDSGELEYVEALARLIADYERRGAQRVKATTGDPLKVLKFLVAESDMSISALGKIIGSQGVASEVIGGKRELSKTHIRKLADYFHVDPGLFL